MPVEHHEAMATDVQDDEREHPAGEVRRLTVTFGLRAAALAGMAVATSFGADFFLDTNPTTTCCMTFD